MTHPLFPPVRRRLLLAAGLGAATFPWARAQGTDAAWPTRPVRILVGFTAGSSIDLKARLLAEPLSKALGQPVVVENRPGAAGNLAADAVAKATDGHTLGVIGNGPLTSSPFLFPTLPYVPQKDLKPVLLIGSAPLMLVAAAGVNFATPEQFLRAAREGGRNWNYGSVGVGSGTHLGVELIKARTGLQAEHIPFNGSPAVINAMIGGQVQMAALPLAPLLGQIQAGRLKPVAMTSSVRSTLYPSLPSLAEIGIRNLNVEVWNSVMAPVAMPAATVARLAEMLGAIVRSDEVRNKLFQQGWRVEGGAPEALAQRIRDDAAMYGAIVKSRGIRLEG